MQVDGEQTVYKMTPCGPLSGRCRRDGRVAFAVSSNGQELASLEASPHQLGFLLAGFLRLRGLVSDFEAVCSVRGGAGSGDAEICLKGKVSCGLAADPVSGSGTVGAGDLSAGLGGAGAADVRRYRGDALASLMEGVSHNSEKRGDSGGTYSAAVGDGSGLLFCAEDVVHDNTLDRIAGEALLGRVDLQGAMLATSGEVSAGMVTRAARLGIGLIASRFMPSDAVIRVSHEAGITLVGYLRNEKVRVYTHAQQFDGDGGGEKILGVTAVILAGGESRRMGRDKSLLPMGGVHLIDHSYRCLNALFEEVILVTNTPHLYRHLPCRKVPDLYVKQGALAGVHSGLYHGRFERAFVVACDMPFLSADVIRYLCCRTQEAEVVIPRTDKGLEPLHAVYRKSCLPAIEAVLDSGQRKITRFFSAVEVVEVGPGELRGIDVEGRSFRNINTPREYFSCCGETAAAGAGLEDLREERVASARGDSSLVAGVNRSAKPFLPKFVPGDICLPKGRA